MQLEIEITNIETNCLVEGNEELNGRCFFGLNFVCFMRFSGNFNIGLDLDFLLNFREVYCGDGPGNQISLSR